MQQTTVCLVWEPSCAAMACGAAGAEIRQSPIMGHLKALGLLKLLQVAKGLLTSADVHCRTAQPQLLSPQPGHPPLSAQPGVQGRVERTLSDLTALLNILLKEEQAAWKQAMALAVAAG